MTKIIYVDMDDVLCDFMGAYTKFVAINPSIKFPQCQYGFFRDLKPIEGGVEGVKYLDAQSCFDVYILTAPSVLNPLCYTEKRLWIEDHLGMRMVEKLIISPHKHLNKGDYLIDDKKTGKGQDKFEGKLIHFGSNSFQNWTTVLEYFKTNYDLR